ncbi:MAG: hypothetical protein H7X99_05945, partial [Saprospiraceae bacterium]|nr:hypothetical protein [Saprospiraceae bacterium]
GVYSDNCPNAVVSVTTRNLLDMCNTGQIKRDFIVTDVGGNTASYTQTIYVIDIDLFDSADITWPAPNVNYNNCNDPDPDTNVTGAPVLNTDHCNLVGATYVDQTFSHPFECSFIRRTWTVIDWCQYQTNTPGSPGKWTFVQNINVINNVPPVIGSKVCRDTTICTQNANCFANVTFNATGTDDCLPVNITWLYKIDLGNNGGLPDITGSGATVTRQYNIGTHKLTWEAKDKCGNISTCFFLFTIRDCKAPNAIAMQGLAINLAPPLGTATIWASDFNNSSSDNCTPSALLKYSFSSDITNTGRVFNCDSLGQRLIELWVTDLAGNQSKTITYVIVQDNQNLCGLGNKVNIKGKVFTEDNISISDTKVIIDGGETDRSLMTDTIGQYYFADLAKYNNYELLPIKDTNHPEGVSTIDIVMIQRHILGLKHLDSPFKMIAADVNNSQSITAADLVELRKLVLGVQSKFSKNTSWRFVDATYTFNDASYPWPFMEKLNYEALATNMNHSDFIGVKVGDVNGSVSHDFRNNTEHRGHHPVSIILDDTEIKSGALVSIPVKSESLNGLLAFQWTFELSPDMVYEGFEAVDIPIRNDNIAEVSVGGKSFLTLSYDDLNGISVKENVTLFNLLCRTKKDTKVSDIIALKNNVTRSVAYTTEEVEKNLSLVFRPVINENPSIVMQNHPNPFKDQTSFIIELQEKSPVNITVYNSEGVTVCRITETIGVGQHTITLTEKQLVDGFGVFFCQVKAKGLNEVIRMLRIE